MYIHGHYVYTDIYIYIFMYVYAYINVQELSTRYKHDMVLMFAASIIAPSELYLIVLSVVPPFDTATYLSPTISCKKYFDIYI